MAERPLRAGLASTAPRGHWLYLLLFAIAAVQALWRYGHPWIAIGCPMLVPIVGLLAYLPRRQVRLRQVAQLVLIVAALVWGALRFRDGISMDLLLVEGLCLLALATAIGTDRYYHDILMLISVIIICYGALPPPRDLYFYLLPAGLGLCLLLLYHSRLHGLSSDPDRLVEPTFRPYSRRHVALHAGLVAGAWCLIFLILPDTHLSGIGYVPVSYAASTAARPPPLLERWLKSPFHQESRDGSRTVDGPRATVTVPKSKYTLLSAAGEAKLAADGGGGSGQPGKRLVMRVKSPAKLYWAGAVYDKYDGAVWQLSAALAESGDRALELDSSVQVTQRVVMETLTSRALFGALQIRELQPLRGRRLRIERHGPLFRLMSRNHIAMPLEYDVFSRLPNPLAHPRPQAVGEWQDRLPRAHYLQLPQDRISDRVRKLAADLTADTGAPMARMYALRDYLRSHYGYAQYSRKLPPGREAADYFLFECEAGHCEYFAASLAVLARLSDLPARIVTGFSPGDYNVLSDEFEVYEYHAHAWTQIYIDGIGWLTVDATPPGAVQSRAKPLVVGSLRDPFGDDWRVEAPELADELQRQSEAQAQAQAGAAAAALALAGQAAGHGQSRHGPNAAITAIDQQQSGLWARPGVFFKALGATLRGMAANAWRLLRSLAALLTLSRLAVLAAGIAIAVGIGLLAHRLHYRWDRRRRLRHARTLYDLARDTQIADPGICIDACYRMLRELLALCGWKKPNRVDLFDYGASLKRIDSKMCRDTCAVFYLYSQAKYSPDPFQVGDARTAYDRAAKARRFLLDYLTHEPGRH